MACFLLWLGGGVEGGGQERMVFKIFLNSALCAHRHLTIRGCSTTGKPTRSFATERVSLDSV